MAAAAPLCRRCRRVIAKEEFLFAVPERDDFAIPLHLLVEHENR
jgi:hypothetical protein